MRQQIEARKKKIVEKMTTIEAAHALRMEPLEKELAKCDALLETLDQHENPAATGSEVPAALRNMPQSDKVAE